MVNSTKNHKAPDRAREARDRMFAELESLKDALAQLRQDVLHVVDGAVGVGKSGVAGEIEIAKSHLNDLKEAGGDQVAALEKRIESNPVAATAIAFGVGVLAAKVLKYPR